MILGRGAGPRCWRPEDKPDACHVHQRSRGEGLSARACAGNCFFLLVPRGERSSNFSSKSGSLDFYMNSLDLEMVIKGFQTTVWVCSDGQTEHACGRCATRGPTSAGRGLQDWRSAGSPDGENSGRELREGRRREVTCAGLRRGPWQRRSGGR